VPAVPHHLADDPLEALRARRHEAARRVATLTFDLGGVTAEMAQAGNFHLDVLVRRAAELRAAEAELAELDRLLAGAGARA
jgi:catechol-2,3-dioxygenase